MTASRPPGIFRGKRELDSVDVEMSVTANVPRGLRLRADVIEQAVMYKAKHGRAPRGFTIKVNRWRNPNRLEGDTDRVHTNPEDAEGQAGWRDYGAQGERIGTLARILRGSHTNYTITQRGRRVAKSPRGRLVAQKSKHRKVRGKKRPKKTDRRRRRAKAKRKA